MKILLLTTELPSLSKGNGGLSRQLHYLIEGLKEHTVYIAGIQSPIWECEDYKHVTYLPQTEIVPDYKVLYKEITSKTRMSFHRMIYNCNLLYSVMESNFVPDVVMYCDIFTYFSAKALKKRYPQIKTIFVFALSFSFSNLDSCKYNYSSISDEIVHCTSVELESFLFADKVIVNTNWVYSYFPPVRKIDIIPNCADFKLLKSLPVLDDIKSDKIKIGYMQRLASNKGINQLLSINKPANVDIYIIGSSDNDSGDGKVDEICKEKGFHFLGKKIGNERFSLIKNFDFMIFPNVHEPFCISLIETVMCGVIPIYTDIPGMGTLFKSEVGVKFKVTPEKFPFQIEDAIEKALTLTPEEKERIIKNGQEEVLKYSDTEAVIKMYSDVVNSLKSDEKIIWSYWDQGVNQIDNPFISYCLETWRTKNPDYKICILDKYTLYKYLNRRDLPFNFDKIACPQNKSDLLRVSLLEKYGGVWMDLSTICVRPINSVFSGKKSIEGFALQDLDRNRGLSVFETYFITAKKGSRVMKKWKKQLIKMMGNLTRVEDIDKKHFNGVDFHDYDNMYLFSCRAVMKLAQLDPVFKKLYENDSKILGSNSTSFLHYEYFGYKSNLKEKLSERNDDFVKAVLDSGTPILKFTSSGENMANINLENKENVLNKLLNC